MNTIRSSSRPRPLVHGLLAGLAVATSASLAAIDPPSQPNAADQPAAKDPYGISNAKLNEILEDVDRRGAAVTSLRANFRQEKRTAMLNKPLVSSGKLAIKGDHTRWDTLEPHRSTMTIDPQSLRIHYPEQSVVEIYDLGDDYRQFSGSPIPRLDKLRQAFEIAHLPVALNSPPANGGKTEPDYTYIRLGLTPKTDQLKQHLTRLSVVIDTRLPCAVQMTVEDIDGDITDIKFSEIKINAEVADKDVALNVPSGTREVRPLGGSPK